ncbi:MAG: hypothetical protein IKG21_10350 [Atopobiaceae bacterium]|nr:hypothetical protein [Atopobiaceae bacterium]
MAKSNPRKANGHAKNGGWKAWTEKGNASVTDGMSLRLEALRIAIC